MLYMQFFLAVFFQNASKFSDFVNFDDCIGKVTSNLTDYNQFSFKKRFEVNKEHIFCSEKMKNSCNCIYNYVHSLLNYRNLTREFYFFHRNYYVLGIYIRKSQEFISFFPTTLYADFSRRPNLFQSTGTKQKVSVSSQFFFVLFIMQTLFCNSVPICSVAYGTFCCFFFTTTAISIR